MLDSGPFSTLFCRISGVWRWHLDKRLVRWLLNDIWTEIHIDVIMLFSFVVVLVRKEWRGIPWRRVVIYYRLVNLFITHAVIAPLNRFVSMHVSHWLIWFDSVHRTLRLIRACLSWRGWIWFLLLLRGWLISTRSSSSWSFTTRRSANRFLTISYL